MWTPKTDAKHSERTWTRIYRHDPKIIRRNVFIFIFYTNGATASRIYKTCYEIVEYNDYILITNNNNNNNNNTYINKR